MKKSLIVAFIGSVMVLAGVFCPWTSAGEVTISGWDAYNVTILAGGIMILTGALAEAMWSQKFFVTLIIMGAILALINGVQVYRTREELAEVAADIAGADTAEVSVIGYGLYLCIAGAILALIGAFWYSKSQFTKRRSRK